MNSNELSKVKHISDWLPEVGEELYNRGGEPPLGIKTLPEFNRKIWGLRPKALTIVGARTSQGKSSFAMQLAWDLAIQEIPVWFLSLEMSVPSLIERLFCHVMHVDNYSLLTGQLKLDRKMQKKFVRFKELLKESTLLITEGLGKTWQEINLLIEHAEMPKVVIVDYIQNISFRAGDTREIINDYILKFRTLAIKHGFAGVLCSQINRAADANAPILSQLKETGFLEECADMVMLLYWKSFYEKSEDIQPTSEYVVNVAKNRNGRTGDFKMLYTPRFYRFSETLLPVPQEDSIPQSVQPLLEMFGGRVVDGG
jgi:replicative DNA helicase